MTPKTGDRVGPFDVVAKLGAGGPPPNASVGRVSGEVPPKPSVWRTP